MILTMISITLLLYWYNTIHTTVKDIFNKALSWERSMYHIQYFIHMADRMFTQYHLYEIHLYWYTIANSYIMKCSNLNPVKPAKCGMWFEHEQIQNIPTDQCGPWEHMWERNNIKTAAGRLHKECKDKVDTHEVRWFRVGSRNRNMFQYLVIILNLTRSPMNNQCYSPYHKKDQNDDSCWKWW
jgi:hypothetical protein